MRLRPTFFGSIGLAILSILVACDREPRGAQHASSGVRQAAVEPSKAEPSISAAADRAIDACDVGGVTPGRPGWVRANQDSLRLVIDRLDQQITTATESDLPQLLFDRGRARASYAPRRGSPHSAYAKAHPEDFQYNEVGSNWLYTGTDLRALARRFPTSELVDDAAYALTYLGRRGK